MSEITQIRVFISCPRDVEAEKQVVRKVCLSISNAIGKTRNMEIKPIDCPSDVIPLITGQSTQTVIDNQLKDYDYDIYIGILWKRFGDKQSNGLTPTEGEFEDALRRRKETGRPIIKFYFKLDEFYPSTLYEAEQSLGVQRFRDKIRNLNIGLYDNFKGIEQFQEKVFESLLYIIENFSYLTSKKISISRQKYAEVPYYVERRVIESKYHRSKNDLSSLMSYSKASQDLLTIVKQRNRIVLLGDAGVGKTTELQRIAWHFSENDSFLYPILVSLTKYVNQSIPDMLLPNWKAISEKQLLIILDGLDEIESKNKNDAIRQIELFSEQHPHARIIISCRTNFYKSETEQSSGTLKGFSSFVLLELDDNDIENFIKARLGSC